jgi:hypothetical protein
MAPENDNFQLPGAAVSDPDFDWRTHYHTRDEVLNAPKPDFMIKDFLQYQSIVGIAGFVAHKKSFIALNISYALCSGAPLFGKFPVLRKPARVLYLCPEMGLIGFSDRVKRIGLLPYVGNSFFFATMSLKDGVALLPQLTLTEIQDAVIIVDTAIRFVVGNENSSEHMKALAVEAFTLIREGAAGVIFLCHSPKSMTNSSELTLENSMRGSGELSAFLFSCWATRMQNPEDAFGTPNLLKQVKSRDFETDSFEVLTSRETCLMTYVENSRGAVVLGKTKTTNVDGREEEAVEVIRNNPKLSLKKLGQLMTTLGIRRGKTWISDKRAEMGLSSIKTSLPASAPP